MPDILPFADITAADAPHVGGKGLSLALTAAAGLPVPPGFCVTVEAFRRHREPIVDAPLRAALISAYAEIGRGAVAVRSSATDEDGSAASFAGQQETILGVEGDEPLVAAVERCWRSLHSERAKAYRAKQGVSEQAASMAVVVQRLVDADVAGVMFTRDPLDATCKLMRIEAAWGLGEVVVSGRVTPDRFQVDCDTGEVRTRQAGDKHRMVTRDGEREVPQDRRAALCLTDDQLGRLVDLGRRVAEFYGDERDIEWAIANDEVSLLQARPITTTSAADRERVIHETRTRLAAIAEPGGTVWSRTNLIEVLREPMPMTWAVASGKLLAADGGTGLMYQDFGFQPDPKLAGRSAYDLIGGRPYMNLSREPRLESAKPLAGYPLEEYRREPAKALDPIRLAPSGLRKWFGLFGMIKVAARITSQAKSFAAEFRTQHLAAFSADVDAASRDDLAAMSPSDLVARFRWLTDRTLVEFARHSLKPTLLAQFCWQVLEQQIEKAFTKERTRETLMALAQGVKGDAGTDLGGAIRNLAAGAMTRESFLMQFGHRGANEMELSAPRWSEDPLTLPTVAGVGITRDVASFDFDALAKEAKWSPVSARSLRNRWEQMRTYLGLRETAKHHLLRGYAEMRRTLIELDRRFRLDDGIFFLVPGELDDLVAGKEMKPLIAERRKTRVVELSLEVPPVVLSEDLDAIGRSLPPVAGAEELSGVALSAGVAEGPALVLTEPIATDLRDYILVCPSTDPAWVPLFVHARGLVMESGGTLSHGAIVAREFGLPAVAGLPAVTQRLRTGQRLRVDGGRGTVSVLPTEASEAR